MMYHVELSAIAKKDLKKIDKHTAKLIMAWIRKNLDGCENPYQHGKALAGNYAFAWCYRIGNYRLIAQIQDEKIIILILNIGHRHDIYQK